MSIADLVAAIDAVSKETRPEVRRSHLIAIKHGVKQIGDRLAAISIPSRSSPHCTAATSARKRKRPKSRPSGLSRGAAWALRNAKSKLIPFRLSLTRQEFLNRVGFIVAHRMPDGAYHAHFTRPLPRPKGG
jgi:hypothetical protein